jgi:hypothetical protein
MNEGKNRPGPDQHTRHAGEAMDSAASVAAHADGMTEVDLAQHLGVNRMTIRRWSGKHLSRAAAGTLPARHCGVRISAKRFGHMAVP